MTKEEREVHKAHYAAFSDSRSRTICTLIDQVEAKDAEIARLQSENKALQASEDELCGKLDEWEEKLKEVYEWGETNIARLQSALAAKTELCGRMIEAIQRRGHETRVGTTNHFMCAWRQPDSRGIVDVTIDCSPENCIWTELRAVEIREIRRKEKR